MKNHSPLTCAQNLIFRSPLGRLLLAAGLGLGATAARAQVNELDVDVRTAVVDRPLDKPFGKASGLLSGTHGKVYAIVAVQLIPAQEKIVKPMDANMLKDEVRHELDAHGFRQMVKGEKPDILLLVQYGRAWLHNPYYDGANAEQTQIDAMPQQNLSMANIKAFTRLQELGIEAKSQKAQFEKLCIKVIAFEYTTDPKAHAKQLWNTLMIVDDPDHRDLNAIAAKMLEAGAPFFDTEIKDEEATVIKPLPEGRVNVGAPEVVEPTPAKGK
jgi:hypothetical protein